MDDQQSHLVEEISQIFSQFRSEVPGRRSAWPESLKSRVLELNRSGMTFAKIARHTKVPYYTILRWRDEKRGPSFRVMNVVDKRKIATVTVASTAASESVTVAETQTVVIFPNGVRIEGVSRDLLRELVPVLGASR
jgi:hypothetical protein